MNEMSMTRDERSIESRALGAVKVGDRFYRFINDRLSGFAIVAEIQKAHIILDNGAMISRGSGRYMLRYRSGVMDYRPACPHILERGIALTQIHEDHDHALEVLSRVRVAGMPSDEGYEFVAALRAVIDKYKKHVVKEGNRGR